MSSKALLKAQSRQESGSGVARRLRSAGKVPGVIYGANREPQMLQLDKSELSQLFRHHTSDQVLVDVAIDDRPAVTAVLKEVQRHPYRPLFVHVDLHEVSMTEVLRATVQVTAVGTPVGVTTQGGILEQPLFEIEIECQAQALPESFSVDVSGLSIGDTLAVADLKVSDEIRILTEPEIALFHVVAPRKVAEAEEAEGAEAGTGTDAQ